MNILLFTENSHRGGLDTFIRTLVSNWPVQDKLTLMCNDTHPGLPMLEAELAGTCSFRHFQYPRYWTHLASIRRASPKAPVALLARLLMLPLRYVAQLDMLLRLRRVFRQGSFDRLMVVNGGYPGGVACRAASIGWALARGKPLSIHNFHNFSSAPRAWEAPFEYLADTCVLRSTARIVSVSSACLTSLHNRPPFRHLHHGQVIPNGIALTAPASTPSDIRQELGIGKGTPLCLMLGTYEKRKGHEFLFRAIVEVRKQYPDVRLAVCGFGYEEEVDHVEGLRRDLALESSVHLLGFRNDVDSLMRSADVLLVSSQEDESFGLTIVEAMARRVPVVATRVGGVPEVIANNEGGILVSASDVDGFAREICRLIGDPPLRSRIGEAGYRRFMEHFTAERMVTQYARLLREA